MAWKIKMVKRKWEIKIVKCKWKSKTGNRHGESEPELVMEHKNRKLRFGNKDLKVNIDHKDRK